MTFACIRCQLALVPKTIGITVEEMSDRKPYRMYYADVLECPQCGFELGCNFGTPDYCQAPRFEWPGPFLRIWNTPRDKARFEEHEAATALF